MRASLAIIQETWCDSAAPYENLFATDLVTLKAVDTSRPYYLPVTICADRASQEAFVRREIDGLPRLAEVIDLTHAKADQRLAKYEIHTGADDAEAGAP